MAFAFRTRLRLLPLTPPRQLFPFPRKGPQRSLPANSKLLLPWQPDPSIAAAPASYPVQRKAERVSMAGTNAYAIVGEQGDRRARVIDLGFGGVALEFEQPEELKDSLLAILHVPILPPVRVFLKPVWSRRTTEGTFRLGCHFVS